MQQPATGRGEGRGPQAPPSISQQVEDRLAPCLGDFNAKIWVKVVASRELGLGPEEITRQHLEPLLDGLRGSLNMFLGNAAADELCKKIIREVR